MTSAPVLFAVLLAVPMVAHAEVNIVTQVATRADGGKTIVTVRGSATPVSCSCPSPQRAVHGSRRSWYSIASFHSAPPPRVTPKPS